MESVFAGRFPSLFRMITIALCYAAIVEGLLGPIYVISLALFHC
jgi:hypothetical protein